ncbi:MAG: sodium/solute symporter [Chthoniobacterales bacterium]|nr:sodium/solute symporter [Chthoniobacterales bacterium]
MTLLLTASPHPLSTLDIILFLVFVIGVVALGIYQGEKAVQGEDGSGGAAGYFLAGRGLTWWLVGFSLIAANISTEQFVGMSGAAADWLGMAIASYEWMAAVTLVVVAFVFLPKLLRCGIYTIPEFLEYRYGSFSRFIMAVATLVILVGVPTASVIYSGAKVISVFFEGHSLLGLDFGSVTVGCWVIGLSAALYVMVGGLRACAWTDLVWGASLILGGALVMWLAFAALGQADPAQLITTKVATSTATVENLAGAGAWERFQMLNSGPAETGENLAGGKLHMIRPVSDPSIPWTALLIGLWIPNFFYWGLNQYIVQRTLGSKSLAEGQKGIVFAAALKLLIPFIVVIPGILCFNLFSGELRKEAEQKNQITLEQMAEAPSVVHAFSESFARNEPDLAGQVIRHNANAAGQAPSIAAGATAADLVDANETIRAQLPDGVSEGTKLIGYDYDAAFPILLRHLLRPGISWFVLAAIFGAVVSSLASMLNSAATIATMDLYQKVRPQASQASLVLSGRVFTMIFVGVACVIAPHLGNPAFGGIFNFIQEFQGFISPGILAVYLFGFLVPRAPRCVGWVGILLNVVLYGALKWFIAPEMAFLNRMAICFGIVVAALAVITWRRPLASPAVMPITDLISLESSKGAKVVGLVVVVTTLLLYALFW